MRTREQQKQRIRQTEQRIKECVIDYKNNRYKEEIKHNLRILLDIQRFNLREGRF